MTAQALQIVYIVTSTSDSGAGSLRQAILDANANPGLDTISFAIGASGSQHTIQPTSVLPSITDPVMIDGWSQGGVAYSGPPLIEINGALAGSTSYALRITSGSTTVRGLVINRFVSGTGVILLTAGTNWIYGNFIGVNLAGDTAAANASGISINANSNGNIIGTNGDGIADDLESNLISGNGDYGILFAQANTLNNVVAGNKIGTDLSGTAAIPNGTSSNSRCGIYLGGAGNRIGTDSNGVSDNLERNLISGNHGCGIALNIQSNPAADPNLIAGNFIGTDITGMAALPNSGSGLSSSAGPNFNPTLRKNVISGNDGGGILISGLNQAVITGNYIGVGADGVTPLGNGSPAYNGNVYGIFLSGSDNQIGGNGPGEGNIIANQTAGGAYWATGIALGSAGLRNVMRGNQIYNNKNLGIDLNDDNLANPNDDGDGDTGANNLQNFPVITLAQSYTNGETVIQGTLNSQASTTFTLDFYYSAVADDSGFGEGEYYLGSDQVSTDMGGWVTFTLTLNGVAIPGGQYVTATATEPNGNTSEFSLAFGPISGVQDVPISGLGVQVYPPIYVDLPTTFIASISAGTNVAYGWDFGDGSLGSGSLLMHTFSTAGVYTATVTASNNSSSAITSTLVTVLEPANINGVVWYDKDEDGFFGLGESSYLYPGGAVVNATLQNPLTVLNDVRDNQGNYQIFTPQSGLYLVEVSRPFWHTTSSSPVAVAMSTDGGTTINFGMNLDPSAGTGRINGRAWIDSNGSGYPDPGETPLASLSVTLRNAGGVLFTGSTDVTGWINLVNLTPDTYWVEVTAPAGYYPPIQTRMVQVNADKVTNAHAPFLPGGSLNGQVSGQNGAGLGGVILTLLPDNLQTTTAADGSYSFTGLADGVWTVQINPPTNYVTLDGMDQRTVPVALNSGVVENWTLLRKGQLTVQGTQFSNGQVLPVGNMFYELLQNGSVLQFVSTNLNGQAVVDGLLPGTYTVRPLAAAVLPDTLVNPAMRTVVVTYDSAATVSFNFDLARSLNLHCLLPGTPPAGFDCLFEVRSSNGSLIESGSLPANHPVTILWNLNPATLEVRLIPDPSVPGQVNWPTHSQIVVLDNNTHANVYYSFNPTNLQTISGYAYYDRCAPLGTRANVNNCTETSTGSNNGLAVSLLDSGGTVITTTQTTNGAGYNTGYFAFPNLAIGTYRVAVDLPTGFTSTTAIEYGLTLDGITAPQQFFFGYQLDQNRSLLGRVYIDMNSNGQYDPNWDDPLPGVVVTISTPTGQMVATRTTASDGSFNVDPISSGEYRVAITYNGNTLIQAASVPASGAIPNVEFALPPADNQPRVLVFVDEDRDGMADPDEQRLSGIGVSLLDKACGQIGTVLETKPTLSDGTVTFAAPPATRLAPEAVPPPGGAYLCAVIASGLSGSLVPTSNIGVNARRASGEAVLLPVQPISVLMVNFFWDTNGDTVQDVNEPSLGGGSLTVNGVNRSIPNNGPYPTSFLLLPGSYPLAVTTPPFGYQPATSMPMTVVLNPNAPQTVSIPFRAQSGISGLINGSSASLVGGLKVELENIVTGQIWQTTSSYAGGSNPLAGSFAFDNLPGGVYSLRLPVPPPGYLAANEPLVNLPSNTAHTENLALAPVGHVAGQVFLDINSDGQRQGGENGSNAFEVQLISTGGQVLQSATPAPDGSFILEGLTAYTPYALRLVFPNSGWFTTASPGVFTVGAVTVDVQLGVGYHIPSSNYVSVGVGNVYYLQDGVKIELANASIAVYNAANQVIGEAHSSANGIFSIPFTEPGYYRLEGNPGFEDTAAYSPIKLPGNCDYALGVIIYGVCTMWVDVELTPPLSESSAGPAGSQAGNTTAVVRWSAFRDDNGNQLRDAGEPGMPGVILTSDAASSLSNAGGLGELVLPDGLHTLTITPPEGYLAVGESERLLSVQGSAVRLPPIPLRPVGITTVIAFLDLDGDGKPGLGEAGVGGVTVTLSGASAASGVTALDGRLMFAALPDGSYTLSISPPIGFDAPTSADLTINNSGMVSVPLYPVGVVTALVYDDWDGDGLRAADEILFHRPFTLTLQNGSTYMQLITAAGLGDFMGVSPGSYMLASLQTAVAGQSVTLPSGGGVGAGLAVVAPGVVRGMLWLDSNTDGLRQPWEAPLAGVNITLGGSQSTVTDQDGRYAFYNVSSGNYVLSAALPPGLQGTFPTVKVVDGRGEAVGLPVKMISGYTISLPLIKR